jgi:polar amino acid transport system ATP-binding protein
LAHLVVDELHCSYGETKVLNGVSLTVDKGEVVSLIGPSGSGKSTFLRSLIGLSTPTGGQVSIGGQPVDYRDKQSLKTLRAKMAIVFQQYNLFQNMSVFDNLTIAPIKIQKRPAEEVKREARELLALVGMAEKEKAFPDELSGGQQQRVAIARALALKPDILLLDEVTSALDPERVHEVLEVIRRLADEKIAMLIVSHEMSFVREVSTSVAMLDGGRVIEQGPPAQIFGAPREDRTKSFVSSILRH